jgi:hypothetical protein
VYWSFGWLPSDKLPEAAVAALEDGLKSPTLIDLAAAGSTANPDLHRKFETVLQELGSPRLSKTEAGRRLAREFARKISDGEIAPIDGAKAIWKIELECRELRHELGIFGGRASEYEGCPQQQGEISEVIVEEAKELLQGD